MAKKEFTFKGKTIAELQRMSIDEFAQIAPSRARRTLKHGFSGPQKVLLEKLKKGNKVPETHCRDMIVIPDMLNKTVKVHNGKDFIPVIIQPEMLGHYLGEFSMTRRRVAHSAPGIGATRSSAAISVK